MTTDKQHIARLVQICHLHGIENVLFSPGSRNAPLIIAFSEANVFRLRTIHDERVAGFFALGQGIKSKKPSVLCCTSGSALLNYSPAIVEAYYQNIPLLVISADRPTEWIDMGIGQSMRQFDVFHNYIKKSYDLVQEPNTQTGLWYSDRQVNEAINLTISDRPGPVHINIPLVEPLYNQEATSVEPPKVIYHPSVTKQLDEATKESILGILKKSEKLMVIVGLHEHDQQLSSCLSALVQSGRIVLLSESTSNIHVKDSVQCIDRCLHGMSEGEDYRPDTLISIGGPLVSKKIKGFLNRHKPQVHIQVSVGHMEDTYQALTHHLDLQPAYFFNVLLSEDIGSNSEKYQKNWQRLIVSAASQHQSYLQSCDYSDLVVFAEIYKQIPPAYAIHLANSTPVRYAQLFESLPSHRFYANRGVSGIDGCTSTAFGFADLDSGQNLLITGDIAFFYDGNAFWSNTLPKNLSVILINNSGGNIFRYIDGPSTTNQLESTFEATHDRHAKQFCEMYKIHYMECRESETLETSLQEFFLAAPDCLTVLEIFTPRLKNAAILKDYFKSIKLNS